MDTKKLRQRILDLAIHGKLVPQDPNDEPASVLLERIKAEKVSKNPSDKRHYENINFEMPNNWTICTVEDIFELNPKNKLDDSTTCGFIPMTLVRDGFGFSHSFEKRRWGEVKKGYSHFRDGDIGIAKISPCFENRKSTIFVNLPNGVGAGTTELSILRGTYICNKFYLFLFQTDWYIKEGMKYFKGVVGQQRVNKEIFTLLHIPLPPLNEQKRIADKIEELFCIIDILESNQNDLGSLVKQAKTKILDLAIEGKLVPQDPNDEPASELLKRINPKLSTSCDNPHYENTPFEIPKSWVWVRLGDIGKWKSGSTPSKSNLDYYKNGNILWLTTGELNNGIVYDTKVKISQQAFDSCSLKLCKVGDVLIAMYGATIGKVAIAGREMTTNQACCACSLHYNYNLYLFWLLQAYKPYFIKMGEGGAQPNISKEKIINTIVPFPPLNEQKCIVAKIEELFSTLDSITKLLK